jgi:voltage-gated potassium channel
MSLPRHIKVLHIPFLPRLKRKVSADIMLTVLALMSVALLTFEIVAEIKLIDSFYIYAIDMVISFIFLGDWVSRFRDSSNKTKFVRKYWWELLAAVPVYIEPTGILRFVRLVVRLRILFNKSRHFMKHAYPLEIFSFFVVIMFGGAELFHSFEYGVNENVHNFFDSIWWSMVTITTIGYGDIAPVTTGGRIVAMMLMMLGIGFLGLTTGIVARTIVVHKE